MSKKLAEIRSILQEHHEEMKNAIPLIASENVTSPAVLFVEENLIPLVRARISIPWF
ncbi:MAG: hypothetical protein GF383_11275 [Candidatus Lokiarchaeota archaeon]|nr:hypothetical protein [Candidatus Lokiarchaeota archaeon]MBD3341296.1 hypothetical protein [Candidatus Lokiarchaeota archaeon]